MVASGQPKTARDEITSWRERTRWRAARAKGLIRSLQTYHWPPSRRRLLDDFYRPLVPVGGLCFDIGAHAGDRTFSWRRLGARVVALEPQRDFARLLRLLSRGDGGVEVAELAVGERPGEIDLHVSPATPTVTTASTQFLSDVGSIPSFQDVEWRHRVRVRVVTLDGLIERFGVPDFVKIDVEGHEAAVLRGLSRPLPAMSFEFLAGTAAQAMACLDRIEALGPYRFNVSRGESLHFVFADWQPRAELDRWFADVAGQDFSGDVYARLLPDAEGGRPTPPDAAA